MLNPDERALIQAFVDKSPPDTAYLRRARILLLHDAGMPAETAAGQVGVSITQARNLLRAVKRQGLALFPDNLFRERPLFAPDAPIAEAGRLLLARQLADLMPYSQEARDSANVTAVHEARKVVREMDTAFKLFGPFFVPGLLENYRLRFRKMMRHLGESRDVAVFLEKLTQFLNEDNIGSKPLTTTEREALAGLLRYWQARQTAVDEAMQQNLTKPEWVLFFDEFSQFTSTIGQGAVEPPPATVVKVCHVAPELIYRQTAAVRAYEDYLEGASLTLMHRLRVQAKELRYTLQFFEPLMNVAAIAAISTVKQIQEHLGELNDARIALEFLAETAETNEESLATAVALYRTVKEEEIARLITDFEPIWNEFNQLSWRQKLATAVAIL